MIFQFNLMLMEFYPENSKLFKDATRLALEYIFIKDQLNII